MPVITISRGSYSHGKEVAECLAGELGYDCISRDILVEASEQFNIPELKLGKALHDAPTVLERFSHDKEQYIDYVKSALFTHIAQGNIVYHGLAGHFFLQDISHVIKIRIIAKMEDRVAEEMEREGCDEQTARYNICKDDEARRRWGLQLYDKDTWDSRLYDMVLCVGALTVNDIVEMIATVTRKPQFQETAGSVKEFNQRMLLANINAMVNSISPHTKVNFIGDSAIELRNMSGWLKVDETIRKEFTDRMRSKFNIKDVVFREPVQPYKGYINPYHNLDVH